MKRMLLILLALALGGPATATEVEVVALFTGKAVLRIDGKRRVLDAGDHAVEWGVYYYTKQVRHLLQVRQQMRELILRQARKAGLSLATPLRVAVFAGYGLATSNSSMWRAWYCLESSPPRPCWGCPFCDDSIPAPKGRS